MPGGRPPKPTALKLLHGDDKKNPQRVRRTAPIPSADEIKPPYQLRPEVHEVWDRLAPDRIAKGVLTAWDVDAFAQFCEAIVMARHGARTVLDEAETSTTPPWTRFVKAIDVCAKLGGRFGWTPADRERLVMATDDGDDDDLLTG